MLTGAIVLIILFIAAALYIIYRIVQVIRYPRESGNKFLYLGYHIVLLFLDVWLIYKMCNDVLTVGFI